MTSRKRATEYTIAFAISIVHSKPPELSIREYIQRLRQHVAKGRRENAISSVYRHLDRSSFWRSEYDRVQAKLKGLERENAELKRRIERSKGDEIEDSQLEGPARKRKKAGEDASHNTISSRKRQKTVGTGVEAEYGELKSQDDLQLPHLGETGQDFLRVVLHLGKKLRNGSSETDAAALGFQITTIATSIPEVVQKEVELHSSTHDNEMNNLEKTLQASLKAYSMALQAFKQVGSNGKELSQTGHPIYSLVQMFSNLIILLQNVARASPVGDAGVRPATGSKTVRARAKPAKASQVKEGPILGLLTQLMCSMVGVLDSSEESHKSIFEGFFYIILDSVGSSLYTLIFGHRRPLTLEAEIAMDPSHAATRKSASSEVATAKNLAPCLIQLLKQVMKAAPAYFGAETSSKTSISGSSRTKQADGAIKSPAKGALTIVAKERLQRTLVKCCFGTESMDESDPFFDCLNMPPLPKTPLVKPKTTETDVQDWFKEELWSVLGWDILARDDM